MFTGRPTDWWPTPDWHLSSAQRYDFTVNIGFDPGCDCHNDLAIGIGG